MKIATRIEFEWDGDRYVPASIITEDYEGPVTLCTGAEPLAAEALVGADMAAGLLPATELAAMGVGAGELAAMGFGADALAPLFGSEAMASMFPEAAAQAPSWATTSWASNPLVAAAEAAPAATTTAQAAAPVTLSTAAPPAAPVSIADKIGTIIKDPRTWMQAGGSMLQMNALSDAEAKRKAALDTIFNNTSAGLDKQTGFATKSAGLFAPDATASALAQAKNDKAASITSALDTGISPGVSPGGATYLRRLGDSNSAEASRRARIVAENAAVGAQGLAGERRARSMADLAEQGASASADVTAANRAASNGLAAISPDWRTMVAGDLLKTAPLASRLFKT